MISLNKTEKIDNTTEKKKTSAKKPKSGTGSTKKQSGLHEGHRQRMFSKYSETGLKGFKEHEILEMALFSVFTRINTNEIAHELLNRFSTILGVLNATISELCEIPNISKASALRIKFLGDFVKYVSGQTAKIVRFKKTAEFVEYGRKIVDRENREILLVLFLDQNNILVSSSKYAGSSDSVKANIKLILQRVSETNCKKLVLIHNHLNEQITPSSSDIKSTRQLNDMLSQINVAIADHIIIGTNNTYRSFHEDKIIEGI